MRMGKMETESTRRTHKNEMKKLVLETVKFAGILSVALLAPNAIGAMAKLGMISTERSGEYVNACRDRLIKRGLMTRNRQGLLRLTSKGEQALRVLQLSEYGQKKKRIWDRKWRILIFDIPEYRRGLRSKVRRTLEAIGFVQLQRSVWVYPYDCEDLIALLKADFHIGNDILYLIVDSIENDRHLRVDFNLSA